MRGKGRGNADLPCGGPGTYEEVTVERYFSQAFQKLRPKRMRKSGEGRKDHNLGFPDCELWVMIANRDTSAQTKRNGARNG